jgi:hypothetical protein
MRSMLLAPRADLFCILTTRALNVVRLCHAAGSLVANAPHLPVHLGAMSEAVRFQVAYYGPGGQGQEEGLQVCSSSRRASSRSSSSSKSVASTETIASSCSAAWHHGLPATH